MDFLQRGNHQNQTINSGAPATSEHPSASSGRGKKRESNWLRYITGLLLLSVTVLIVALLISIVVGAPKSQSKYVKSDQLQAVFLNNGQVYFGNISTLNAKYIRLTNIYYLRVNQTVQPNQTNSNNSNDVSLVKLGCELHGPQDEMLINADQVTFWENLKGDGQVAKAVSDYVKANPNGQNCATSTSSSSSTPSTSTTKKQ